MLRVVVKTFNRRNVQVNATEDIRIETFDIDAPTLEAYLRDYDEGWQSHQVIGIELSKEGPPDAET